jgi:hypothetical protein
VAERECTAVWDARLEPGLFALAGLEAGAPTELLSQQV